MKLFRWLRWAFSPMSYTQHPDGKWYYRTSDDRWMPVR